MKNIKQVVVDKKLNAKPFRMESIRRVSVLE